MTDTGKSIRGPIDSVPCPHCGRRQDFRILQSEQLLDTGHQLFCDFCKRSQEVTQIQTVTFVAVRKDPSGKVAPAGGQRRLAPNDPRRRQLAQPNAKPGFFQKLFGPPRK